MNSDAFLVSFVATLFSMMNPIGNLGIFASLTESHSEQDSKKIALTCALTVGLTLISINWLGKYFLQFFGISIPTLQAAGGIIVLIIGVNMLLNKTDHKTTDDELADSMDRHAIAVVPLGIPIVAGPGSMAAVLLATSQTSSDIMKLKMSFVILAISVFTGVLFYFSQPVSKLLGKSTMGVITRIMGLVLSSIAMGLLADGLKALFPVLGH